MSKFQAILCDDVRKEDNGKYIAIGMYTEGLSTDAWPIEANLSLLVIISDLESGDRTLNIAVITKDTEPNDSIRHFEFSAAKSGRATLWFTNVPINSDVKSSIDIYCSIDDEDIRLIDAIPLDVVEQS